ncbi:dihydroneopterin aldolase [Sulfurospirillum multivorans]|uniref:Dihydroneopterin aldolase n=2 Tax=Sulfurospirillum multivorans TaxID=66821 RepID=A0AA86AKM4_SULMK|nr:dihydroneopterin aldolase [Sulfurospirillum multivorans]AHJ11597.1 putative dihydroneopterin aldolase [Sulfurospirillum multivorans DSM 12446]QEH05097.1 putative dihydroneopterin aldolase [Sulfurospirillum multivorans]
MQIHIDNLTFETIVGILEKERLTPQKVTLHVKIAYDYQGDNFIDYAKVSAFLESEMNAMCYFLLEDALKDLSQKLKVFYPQISKLKLKILKPDILPNAIVGVSHTIYYAQN